MLSMSMGRRNTQMTMKPIIIPMGLLSSPNKEKGSRTCTDKEICQTHCSEKENQSKEYVTFIITAANISKNTGKQ